MSKAMIRQAHTMQRGDTYTLSGVSAVVTPVSHAQKDKKVCPVSHLAKGADKEGDTHGLKQVIIIILLNRTSGLLGATAP